MIPFWLKALALGLIVAGLVAACHHRDATLRDEGAAQQRATDQLVADDLKRQAALALDDALKAKAAAERRLADFKNTQEVKDAQNVRDVAVLNRRLAALAAGNAGRLLDPNAPAGGCGPGGGSAAAPATAAAGPGGNDAAQAGGLLSADLSGLLLRLTREADEVNNAYISCRADAYSVRGLTAP